MPRSRGDFPPLRISKSRCKPYRLDSGMGSASAAAVTVSLLRLAARDIFPAKEKGHDVNCDWGRHAERLRPKSAKQPAKESS